MRSGKTRSVRHDGEIITRHYSLPADYKVFRGLTTSRKRLLWMRTQRTDQ